MTPYEKPQIEDLGRLSDLTQGSGQLGGEDGIGKAITATVDPLARVSVGVLP